MIFKKHAAPFSHKQGFSLIEIMIFTIIITTVFIVAISYVINLVRTMKINEHKILATYYAEEVREWLNGEKQADWDAFSETAGYDDGAAGGSDPTKYCFNNDIAITDVISQLGVKFPNQSCTGYTGITGRNPIIFKREVILSKDSLTSPTSVEALIVVTWLEGGTEYKVPVNAKFTVWE